MNSPALETLGLQKSFGALTVANAVDFRLEHGARHALIAQTTQFVSLSFLSLERSGTLLIMLIIGGVGQLYGAFIGVPLYMVAQNRFSEIDPVYWYFWIGLLMVVVVVFARGGVLGLSDRFRR